MLFFAAFLTGLFGSFHCAGMCGPIAFALPGKGPNQNFLSGRLIYNLGRILTYSILGILFGAFGLGLKMAGFQQAISITAGVFILVVVILQYFSGKVTLVNPFSMLTGKWIRQLFGSDRLDSFLLIGMLNGFLPCGFVYIALLGASVTQDIWEGALFMACFGMGTLPMMFGVSLAGQFISQRVRSGFNKWSPVLAVLIACFFILRGLNLGIPYVSPKINTPAVVTDTLCH